MKLVFSNSEVPHIFASRTQNEGRNSGNSIFFRNNVIYSYGHHFPMAAFSKDDSNTVFITTRGYSNSTAKHLNYTRQALNHFNMIFCNDPEQARRGEHHKNLETFNSEAKSSAMKLRNARKPENYLSEISHQRNLFAIYCEHFKIKLTKKLMNSLPYLFIESQDGGKQATDKEVKAIAKAKKEREERAKKEHAIDLAEFKSFERQRMHSRADGMDHLRFNPELNTIETSQGINIEIEEARRVYNILLKAIDRGGCVDCGLVDGKYKINSVTSELVKIGCHNLQVIEILEIGQELFK